MTITPNHTKDRLKAGTLSIGFAVRKLRGVDLAKIARACDYDWLFIDMEHGSMDLDDVAQLCVAALDTGITPLVRVPGHEHYHAARVLDNGAMGIIIPHVDTAKQAARAVNHCLFPPAGHRSLGGPLPQLGFATLDIATHIETSNANTLVVVMLETPAAIENVESIAATPGVDVLHIGCNDLAAEIGIPGEFGHHRIEQAIAATLTAAAKHGKTVGIGGINDTALTTKYVDMGVRFVTGGADYSFLTSAATARGKFLRGLEADMESTTS